MVYTLESSFIHASCKRQGLLKWRMHSPHNNGKSGIHHFAFYFIDCKIITVDAKKKFTYVTKVAILLVWY